jgi:hypothetical protein
MTSVITAPSQIPANKLYANLAAAPSSITLVDGATVVPWLTGRTATAGALIVRDMGKSVYIPDPTVPSAVGSQSTILRKVQLVPTGAGGGYYGTGGAAGTTSEYYTGYIRIGGQTFGGGDGTQAFVRLN